MSRAQSFPDNRQEFSGEFPRAWRALQGCLDGTVGILLLLAELESQGCLNSPWGCCSEVSGNMGA